MASGVSSVGGFPEPSPTRTASPARTHGRPDGRGVATTRLGSLSFAIALVGGVSLVLGLIRLGTPSFWVDEAFTARALHRSLPALFERQVHIVYYAILKPWGFVAGDSEWALRFPSVVGAALACVLLVVLARMVFDRWAALVSGLLLAINPFLVKWSQQARGYTLMVALSLLATILLVRALHRETRSGWAWYGLAFTLLVVWHPVGGLLLVAPHLVLVWQRRERVLPQGLVAALVVLALGVPWGAVVAMRSTGEGVAMNWLRFPSPETAAWAFVDVSGVGLGALLAALGLWVLVRTGRRSEALWLGVWAFSPFLVSLAISTVRPIYLDRYLIVAAPAFALLGGLALMGVGSRARAVLAAIVAAGACVGLAHWYAGAGDGNWHGEDWRRAVATALARKSDAGSLVVADWSAFPAAEYYGAHPRDTSTAASIWVLRWSEGARDLSVGERRALGFGDHRLRERIPFGRRLSLQLWQRG